MCVPINNQCPNGTYFNGVQCINYGRNCSMTDANMIWNPILVQCVCRYGTFFNGRQCISCPFTGMIYSNNDGCICPSGTYLNGTSCVKTS